jgi:hypothetical protein
MSSYNYTLRGSVRPHRNIELSNLLSFKTEPNFVWKMMAMTICSTFDFHFRAKFAGRWMNDLPLKASLFRDGNLMVIDVKFQPDSLIEFYISNPLEPTRRWNQVQIMLAGARLALHRPQITDHESRPVTPPQCLFPHSHHK